MDSTSDEVVFFEVRFGDMMSQLPGESDPNLRVRLAKLDLYPEDFEFALRAGDAERRMCSPLDPPVLASWLMWAKTIGALRERLTARDWTFHNEMNVPRTVHHSESFGIVVNTGDAGTGDGRYSVSTKYPRGLCGARAVELNGQLALFNGLGVTPPSDEQRTWILLMRIVGSEIRSELSLPAEVTPAGQDGQWHITRWIDRICLPPLSIDGGEVFPDDDDGGPEFDVPVTRR